MGESYPYEDLDGRRFQRLAQSLITAERPRAQCLPIAGPDGGRDSVVLEFGADKNLVDAIIYQVKFHERNPLGTPSADDLYKWVTKNLTGEIPKLQLLKRRGAREFIFVTNVPASGHLETGLRDRVQQWVKEHIPLPTFVWWRDDVDARLDRHPSLVFKFMLFRGPDAVQAHIAQTLTQNPNHPSSPIEYATRNPAVSIILLYLSRQYDEESSLRFKQAYVDAPIIDSFVDVPLSFDTRSTVKGVLAQRIEALAEELDEATETPEEDYEFFLSGLDDDRYDIPLGAAAALLRDHSIQELDRLVIEAGPGQGKSTLVQFLGQVHRGRLLNKETDLARLPATIAQGPLRLPFRIELRHLGKWLQGISPWTGKQETETRAGIPGLHSYIADHVRHVTSGMRFSSDDVVAIVSSTPTLLLLDGLDEVADVSLREIVIKTVTSFVQDMESLGAKLQVIATGRPSSLASAPTFQKSVFLYGQLEDLTINLTEKYTNGWISRRGLPSDQASELRGVLAGCLVQPHVAELARTPMQLAILLWLVHTRGWNLPDKRTALYDEYINTLLDREADKTSTVRKYRDVLVEIHGYLGWLLHSRSQDRSGPHGAGDIDAVELKRVVWEYLEAKEGPSDHIKEILEGIHRIFVLVDRIEGRFEFQVQPLREFFAARHLYKTAPYHTNAVEVTGSRPERLEALIRDSHWTNVARFFCGWYDVGELADLTQRISELFEDEQYRFSLHARLLVAYLLTDYVSAAAPKCTRKIANFLTGMLSMRQILEAREAGHYQAPTASELIPSESGLPTVFEAAKKHYREPIADAIVYELGRLIRQIPAPERSEWWEQNLPIAESPERDEWIRRGVIANCLSDVSTIFLGNLFDESSTTLRWVRCVESGRMDVATTGGKMRRFIDAMARGYSPLSQSGSPAQEYVTHLTRFTLRTDLQDPRFRVKETSTFPSIAFDTDADARQELGRLSELALRCEAQSRANTKWLPERANIIGEALGEHWAAWRLALSVAPWGDYSEHATIGDESIPISKRAASLWCHRADLSFWRDSFQNSSHDGHVMAVACALMTWAPARVISGLTDEVRRLCQRIEPWEFSSIRRFVGMMNAPEGSPRLDRKTRIREGELDHFNGALPACLLTILEQRMGPRALLGLGRIIDNAQLCTKHAGFVSGFTISRNMRHMAAKRDWGGALGIIRDQYPVARSDVFHMKEISPRGAVLIISRMSMSNAKQILEHPYNYPIELIMLAEAKLEQRHLTLHEIAQAGRWFA